MKKLINNLIINLVFNDKFSFKKDTNILLKSKFVDRYAPIEIYYTYTNNKFKEKKIDLFKIYINNRLKKI